MKLRMKPPNSILFFSILILSLPSMVFAHTYGMRASDYTGAPSANNCTNCHSGTVNSGSGKVQLFGLPASYTANSTYNLKLHVIQSGITRWGFQLKASSGQIVVTDPTNTYLGSNTYLNQTTAGTFSGQTVGQWNFNWTAPATASANVIFYASGLAANGTGGTGGDYTYTLASTLNPYVAPPAPTAGFYGVPVSGAVPLVVNFVDTSANSPTGWTWNFGDGQTSTQQNPTHKYLNAGSYPVTLIANNTYGTNTLTKSNYIVVSAWATPQLLPDIKILKNNPLSNAFVLSNYTNAAGWLPYYIGNVGSASVNPATKAVDYLTPLTSGYAMDTIVYVGDGTLEYPSVLKYSSYLLTKLEPALVDDGQSVENCSGDINSSILKDSGTPYPGYYSGQVNYSNPADIGKILATITGSTGSIQPNAVLIAPAQLVLTVKPDSTNNDWEKQTMDIYEILDRNNRFSSSNDTTGWFFEIYADGTGTGTLSWASSYNGQDGVIQLAQAAGQKAKLSQIFTVPVPGWYTAKAKVATDIADVTKQQKVYLYLQEFNQNTVLSSVGNQVVSPGNGAFEGAGIWKQLEISFYTASTILGVQIVGINNLASGVSGSLYIDDIYVYQSPPPVEKSFGATNVPILNANFDSDIANWLIQIYADGTGPGTWSWLSSWVGHNGVIQASQAGSEKGKASQLFNFPNAGRNATAKIWVYSNAGSASNTQKVYLYLYSYNSAYTKVIESGNAILQAGQWTPGVWRQLQFGYTPLSVYNAIQFVGINPSGKPSAILYFDEIAVNQDQDSSSYWDHTLF
jgi:PKD repeat protein